MFTVCVIIPNLLVPLTLDNMGWLAFQQKLAYCFYECFIAVFVCDIVQGPCKVVPFDGDRPSVMIDCVKFVGYRHRYILCAYTHTHIHTCIHAYMHTCIHAYIHTYIHMHNDKYLSNSSNTQRAQIHSYRSRGCCSSLVRRMLRRRPLLIRGSQQQQQQQQQRQRRRRRRPHQPSGRMSIGKLSHGAGLYITRLQRAWMHTVDVCITTIARTRAA